VKKPEYTAIINAKVSPNVRIAVEKMADERGISLAEAARHLLDLGLKHQAAMA
jgi:hypothetical protein